MINLINEILGVTHQMVIWQYAIYEICLVSIGILLGLKYFDVLTRWKKVIWAIFAVALVALIAIFVTLS